MARPMIDPKHLVLVAVPEALVVAVVIVRGVVLGGADLEKPLHLGWMVGTILLAASALSVFIMKSIAATRAAGPDGVSAEDKKALLGPSLGILGLALLVAVAGPGLLERLLG